MNNLQPKQLLVLACAIFAAVIAALVMLDVSAVREDAFRWLAAGVFVAAIGLGVTAI